MKFLRALGCRLCWRITGGVFASILLVESLILVPSAMRFRDEALRQLAVEAQVAVDAMLASRGSPGNAADLGTGLRSLVGRMHVRGLAAVRSDGSIAAAVGENLEAEGWSADGSRYEVTWSGAASGEIAAFAARLDASHVSGARNAYILRIAGLVALIVLVVTAGTMLALHFIVLRPLMRLRESMRQASEAPERASEYAVPSERRDELGEMISAHNSMLGRVVESIRRDREIAEERARILSHHDALTGMPNRRAFLEHLSRQRTGDSGAAGSITVCLVNVVHLRQFNAALGQQAGDRLLLELGARLRRAAGAGSFCAHLGAGRFAVARRTGAEVFDPAAFAEQLIRDTAGEQALGDESVSVRLRVGIAQARYGDASPEELLSRAELALERTTTDDSAGYAFFESSMAQAARERQALARALERALGRDDELFLVFQAKASLRGDDLALAGCEALLRWRHPQHGLIRPDVFIPIAEATGLILPLGERVLLAACSRISEWRARYGCSPRVAINLSAHQFAAPGLLELLQLVLAQSAVPASLLELEITESAAMRDVQFTARTLQALHALGIRISIDDFGTGHSSLSYLRRFALDTIKIDKSFVDDIGKDANAEAICTAILGMAHALGRRVVAEGVETEAQLGFLRALRCDEIQGYLYARPQPAEEFERRFLGGAMPEAAYAAAR